MAIVVIEIENSDYLDEILDEILGFDPPEGFRCIPDPYAAEIRILLEDASEEMEISEEAEVDDMVYVDPAPN